MSSRTTDRIFGALGVGFVVTTLAGVALARDVHGGGLSDSAAKVAASIAAPVPPGTWAGGYLEMLSVGCFLAFAAWASTRLGGGMLGQLACTAAAAYAAVIVASLGIMYGLGYREGHGLTVPVDRALDAVNTATYVGSWFLTAFFLLAMGGLAVSAGHRNLGRSAIGAGAVTLVAIPWTNSFGELSVFLFFIWVVAASVALARGSRVPAGTTAAVQHA